MRMLKVAVVALVLLPLAACSAPKQPRASGATVIVVGGRNNMPAPTLSGDAVSWLTEAIQSRDQLLIVSVSGQPKLVLKQKISSPCDSAQACGGFVNDYLAKVQRWVGEVKADSPEADTLGAIIEASRQIAGIPGPKHIIVIDSGLQTTGYLRMQAPGAMNADAAAIAATLETKPDFKELAGDDILLDGIGSTAKPQTSLPNEQIDQLQAFWQTLLTAAKAKVTVDPGGLRGSVLAGTLPAVTVIPPDKPPAVIDGKCLTLRDDQVGFLPDVATFRDQSKALAVLKPIATALKSSSVQVTVTGTTALAENPPGHLSNARAKAVINVLVELGVARGRLHPVGVGTSFNGYIRPYNSDGSFNETLAVQDRLVIIQPAGGSC